jgi:septum formation protein
MLIENLVLASNSPRRKELLGLGGLPFAVQAADINEDVLPSEGAIDYVARVAREKAHTVRERVADDGAVIVAADTTVVLDGQILGKPADADEARAVLKALRGRSHMVYTGFTLIKEGAEHSGVAATEVPMRDYTDAEIDAYVATGNPLDKAGSYAIQHGEFHPVAAMHECYANVVGLPLCHVLRSLRLWDMEFATDLPAACQAHLNYDCPVTDKILNWEL